MIFIVSNLMHKHVKRICVFIVYIADTWNTFLALEIDLSTETVWINRTFKLNKGCFVTR